MDAIIEYLPRIIDGFLMTLRLLVIAGLGALVLGTLIAAMRISPVAALRWFAVGFTELFRNIPLTLILFFCATVLPYLQVRFDYTTFALIGLTLYTSPFVAEAIRSGVNGVPMGQAEAARAIGLSFTGVVGLIVLPQAVRMVIPPLINVLIALTKNTSVAGAFAVTELFATSRQLINLRGDATISFLIGVAVLYLLITIPLGQFANRLEKKVAVLR